MGEQKPVEELYDTQADPHEVKNLAKSGEHAAVLTRMRTAHEKWAVETRDVGLIPEPEVVERERKLGTRMAILQQPGSDRYIARLRAVVDAVNRDSNPALVTKAIKDEDAAIRYWAVVGAAKTAAAAAANKDRVLAALNDSSGVVRIAAARAAGKHFGAEEQAVAVLVKELASDNDQMRHYAIVALDEMGEKARTALPAIEKARKDTNDYVRRVAEHASVQLARG
jgi:uncharacterized sulfatase